jgi:hypothetical protein
MHSELLIQMAGLRHMWNNNNAYTCECLRQGFSTGVPRDIGRGYARDRDWKKNKHRFLDFARCAMLAIAVMDSDRAAISFEVFQPRMAVRSRNVFIWLSPFSVFCREIGEAGDWWALYCTEGRTVVWWRQSLPLELPPQTTAYAPPTYGSEQAIPV